MKTLGFLGAMNRDVVVQRAAAQVLPVLGLDAPPLVETPVSDAIAQSAASRLEDMGAQTHLGGSAFNVARVAALLNQDGALALAFFGLAGSVEGAQPHLVALNQWSVSTAAIATSSQPPATCLAMVEPTGRTLLTATGANAGIVDWLTANGTHLAKDIAACDILHVTSFLDPRAPGLIAALLAEARQINPALVVSLDPGMAWLAPGGEGLASLLRQTRILHLNAEEFALLGGPSAVPAIGSGLGADWLLVTRTHDGATLYSGEQGLAASLHRQLPTAGFKVVDANGAGDTFCGGFLWAYAHSPENPLNAAELGFALARHKVGINGPLTGPETESAKHGWTNW